MAAIEASILVALRSHLIAFAEPRAIPIAFTNKTFTPPADGKFLRESFIPNGTFRPEISDESRPVWRGLYQVDVMWPQNSGETAARTLAADIATHFAPANRLVADTSIVRVTRWPEVAGLMIDDTRAMIPITIDWQVDA